MGGGGVVFAGVEGEGFGEGCSGEEKGGVSVGGLDRCVGDVHGNRGGRT